MPTIVGILTFVSMINTTSDGLKARKIVIFHHFTFYEQLIFFITSGPGLSKCANTDYQIQTIHYMAVISVVQEQACHPYHN